MWALRRPGIFGATALAAACLLAGIALVVTRSTSSSPGAHPRAHQFATPAAATAREAQATGASAGSVPPAPAGYAQVFLDDFRGPKGAPPSRLNWLYDIGTNWGNNQ